LLVHDQHFDLVVAELSSYQLSDLDVWPELGIMLNLYPEHIDWHGTTANYYQDKLKLFAKPGQCIPVVNFADTTVRAAIGAADPVMYFNAPSAIHVHDNDIMDGKQTLLSGADLKLRGQHNLTNICAALTVARYLGVAIAEVAPSLAEFNGLAHRLELIGNYNGITYVDDSISTTPESTMAALAAYPGQTITLLLGGKDRQQDFKALARYLSQQRVFAIVTMHENGGRIAKDVADELKHLDYAPIIISEKDLGGALEQAQAITPQGGIILLSPASPSYDAYKNFQERGLLFRRLSAASA
jgi:UDP-N-acetylmuramoylalanine--D-glutamate ligase